MKKILSIIYLFIVLLSIPYVVYAQGFPRQAVSTNVYNGTISSATTIKSYDQTNANWTLHPENGNLRCYFGQNNGNPPPSNPTATTGMEIVSGIYYSAYPITNPALSLVCIPETGSVTYSLQVDIGR